jgi:hypothetical protein
VSPAERRTNDHPRPEPAQTALMAGFQVLRDMARTKSGQATLLAIGALVSVPFWFSYFGFCFSQWRFLYDDEFFNIAISDIIRLPTHNLVISRGGGTYAYSVKVAQYPSISEFRRRNPSCCAIVPHNTASAVGHVSFCDQFFGRAAKSVLLTYTLNYVDEDGSTKSRTFVAQMVIGNCGRVLNLGA